jgi:hypothetical protein
MADGAPAAAASGVFIKRAGHAGFSRKREIAGLDVADAVEVLSRTWGCQADDLLLFLAAEAEGGDEPGAAQVTAALEGAPLRGTAVLRRGTYIVAKVCSPAGDAPAAGGGVLAAGGEFARRAAWALIGERQAGMGVRLGGRCGTRLERRRGRVVHVSHPPPHSPCPPSPLVSDPTCSRP